MAHNPPGRYGGMTLADIDGDGRFEVLVACDNGANRILKWTGGQLRDVASPAIADVDRSTIGIAAGDLDGDGEEELYLLNQTHDRILHRDADGQWLDPFQRAENRQHATASSSCGLAALDRRGTGRYGFFVAQALRPPRLFELGSDGVLAELARSVGMIQTVPAGSVLAAPIHGAHTDLICLAEQGATAVYRNLGDGTFEECAERGKLRIPEDRARGIAAVDADADGRLDLFLGNTDGPHRLLVRQPDGTWRDRATPALAFPSELGSVLAADFDNDGRDELFLNNRGERNRLFRLHDSISLLDVGDAAEPDFAGTGAAVADLDGDGILELIVAHDEPCAAPIAIYKARGASGNNWLRIRPLTRFGAPARGALVRASVEGRILVKVIDGGSGVRCQMEPVAHFGLGRCDRVEWVSIAWPDGASLTMPNPDVNCNYSVPYPRG